MLVCDTLEDQVNRYVSIKNKAETQTWYRRYLKPMVDFLDGERSLDSVNRADAEEYWHFVQERDTCYPDHPYKRPENRRLATTTMDNHLRAARTFWREMVRQRLVEYNPFDHLKMIKDEQPVQMKAISVDDLVAIWRASRKSSARDFAIVTIMATTGIRAGELVSMSLKRLNLKRGEAWVTGKRGWRPVYLGEMSVRAITAYIDEREEWPNDALWLDYYGERITIDGVRQMINRLAEKADVEGRHNLHSFRHRVAQAWLDEQINPEIVAQALGHADVTVTLAIYSNMDDKRVRRTIRSAELVPFVDAYKADFTSPVDISTVLERELEELENSPT